MTNQRHRGMKYVAKANSEKVVVLAFKPHHLTGAQGGCPHSPGSVATLLPVGAVRNPKPPRVSLALCRRHKL